MDRLAGINAFVKAVDTGSFSAAAEVLEMSPQLVGKLIQKLEAHLGVRLLHRTTRRQSLTDYGHQFYERARNILAELELAESMAEDTRVMPSGKLRINAPVSFGMHTLSPVLPEFLKRYPQVSVELTLSNRMVDLVDEGYDVVFRVGRLTDSRLMARALQPYQLVLCASPTYLADKPEIRTPWDLQQHDCVGFGHASLHTHWVFEGPEGAIEVPVTSRFISDHGEPLLCAAVAGLGVMLQPNELVAPQLKSGALVSLLPEYKVPTRPLHILYASNRGVTPKTRSFLDFASEKFGPAQ
ncbi:LysR family transcriptional regulator [Ralstonia solanacearum species complex bacterium KE056]|uniref:LysR family transcriptional regulator n=1 Tax=Ralstonia solanacearum species complex bacterium KE056 TaxID=3119585 RepID=UPI002FC353F8